MKKSYWIVLFALPLLADLAGIYLDIKTLQWLGKPLVVIVLIIYFLSQTAGYKINLKTFIFFALTFSWFGDMLLMFEVKNSIFFLLGLSAFLLAHIFYILFFHFVRIRENVKSNVWLLLIVVIYYSLLMSILSPFLGSMKLPVRIYGVVISFMLLLAMHMPFIRVKIAGRLLMSGALLFIISDSVLAINKFYLPFEQAGIIIMLTYGLAQLFITEGAIQYIRKQ
jgi:uncharacterized membrane protein YhhN